MAPWFHVKRKYLSQFNLLIKNGVFIGAKHDLNLPSFFLELACSFRGETPQLFLPIGRIVHFAATTEFFSFTCFSSSLSLSSAARSLGVLFICTVDNVSASHTSPPPPPPSLTPLSPRHTLIYSRHPVATTRCPACALRSN